MKLFWIFVILGLIIIPAGIMQSDALRQMAGPIIVKIAPGETQTFTWTLISDSDSSGSLGVRAEGWGSQFLSFPSTLPIEGKTSADLEVTISIPADHPGGVELKPNLLATEFGATGGSTVINIQALKRPLIIISQNENSEYWTNTAYNEPDKMHEEVEVEVMEEKEEVAPGVTEILPASKETAEEGGGCLIATATYGSEMSSQVQMLREIRDGKLLTSTSGSTFMAGFNSIYYMFSPTIADLERESPVFKEFVKLAITPLLTSLSILSFVDMDSEAEVLGYGISIIGLNLGMYIAAPAIAIHRVIRRR